MQYPTRISERSSPPAVWRMFRSFFGQILVLVVWVPFFWIGERCHVFRMQQKSTLLGNDMCVCMQILTRTRTELHTHNYIHVYTDTHTHIHTHTHIYIYMTCVQTSTPLETTLKSPFPFSLNRFFPSLLSLDRLMTEKLDWALEVQSCWLHWKRLQGTSGQLLETLEERESQLRALYLGDTLGTTWGAVSSGQILMGEKKNNGNIWKYPK